MHKASVWELLLYLVVIAALQTRVFLHGWRFSSAVGQRIGLPGLQPGWLPGGLKVDLSDAQWRDFRGSLPLLGAAHAAFLLLSLGAKRLAPGPSARALFYSIFSAVFLVALHGWCALHVALLALLHFALAKMLAGTRAGILVFWAATCGLLVLVRLADGLPFSHISSVLAPLDRHRGLLRWHIHYNLLVLRIISFACDLHWARLAQAAKGKQPQEGGMAQAATGKLLPDAGMVLAAKGKLLATDTGLPQGAKTKQLSAEGTSYAEPKGGIPADSKARIQQHLPLRSYSLLPYWAYLTYAPLYIAGPIITFNSFASQLAQPPRLNPRQVITYGLRWVVALLALELVTHTQHYNSIARYHAWQYIQGAGLQLHALHYAEGCYWVLVFMWLKFTVIWRFFRLVALADGIEPPENMTRCVCNNYDVEGFWRSWHASYNQWLVRYMYVPLGGSRWRLVNAWVIFTFVALWHDLEWRLLGWAWIMALAMAPEMACKAFAKTAWAKSASRHMLWRHACATAAALNILVLMTGNMVGFVVGLDGVAPLAASILAEPQFVVAVLGTLFCAAQLMFALRQL